MLRSKLDSSTGNKAKMSKPSHGTKVTVPVVKSLIRSGVNYSMQLSKHLKVSKQYMGRFLKKMLENGEIEIDIIDTGTKYYRVVEKRVTQKRLWGWCDGLPSGLPYFRDGVQISYGIINYDEWFVPERDWKLGETLMKGIHIDDCFIRIANDKTLTMIFPKIYGKDEVEPITKSDYKSYEIKKKFLKMYPDFELTKMPINMKLGNLGTTVLKDALDEFSGIKTDNFIIDKTPQRGSLEMKITDPVRTSENMRDTVDFLSTGGLKDLMREMIYNRQLMNSNAGTLNSISQTQMMIVQLIKKLNEKIR